MLQEELEVWVKFFREINKCTYQTLNKALRDPAWQHLSRKERTYSTGNEAETSAKVEKTKISTRSEFLVKYSICTQGKMSQRRSIR